MRLQSVDMRSRDNGQRKGRSDGFSLRQIPGSTHNEDDVSLDQRDWPASLKSLHVR